MQSWLQLMLARVGRAIIYTSPAFWNALPAGTGVDPRVELWVAAWGAARPPTVNGLYQNLSNCFEIATDAARDALGST